MPAKVLVADDSSTMRKIIIRSLQAVGIPEATEAADGNEAVSMFKPGEFNLVLTDWNMPGKTGLEVVKEIRAQDAKVPIIMVTTEAEKGRVMQAIEAGVSDYLVKPFTADTLRQKLEKHGCAVERASGIDPRAGNRCRTLRPPSIIPTVVGCVLRVIALCTSSGEHESRGDSWEPRRCRQALCAADH